MSSLPPVTVSWKVSSSMTAAQSQAFPAIEDDEHLSAWLDDVTPRLRDGVYRYAVLPLWQPWIKLADPLTARLGVYQAACCRDALDK